MAIEIVDLPINSMVVFHSYVSLPEGMYVCTFYMYLLFDYAFKHYRFLSDHW
jgi:pyrrolidone-carboxylate peptidase